MPRGIAKRDYTYEEYLEIRKENKRKLEEIMTTPDYMEMLGRKYYGERWFSALPDDHPKKIQRRKDVAEGRIKPTKYMDREIMQFDIDGNYIDTHLSSRAWTDENMDEDKRFSAAQHLVKVAKGDGETAYGYKWRFKEEDE